MKNLEGIQKSLEEIELLLQSINEYLKKPAQIVLTRQDRLEKDNKVTVMTSKNESKQYNQINHARLLLSPAALFV